MAEPGVSSKYTMEEVMMRFTGLNLEQVPNAKALVRLGITEDDLSIAERLLQICSIEKDGKKIPKKEERLLGYTCNQRGRAKALATLGMDEEVLQDTITRIIGSLGPSAFASEAEAAADDVSCRPENSRDVWEAIEGGTLRRALLRVKGQSPRNAHHKTANEHHPVTFSAPPSGTGAGSDAPKCTEGANTGVSTPGLSDRGLGEASSSSPENVISEDNNVVVSSSLSSSKSEISNEDNNEVSLSLPSGELEISERGAPGPDEAQGDR